MAFDFKKEYIEFYMPKNKPGIITVPSMNYIAVRGQGDPNTEDGEYKQAIGLLYGIAFFMSGQKQLHSGASPLRYGFHLRSSGSVVSPPWPGYTAPSKGKPRSSSMDLRIWATLPPGRSTRPQERAKSVSPENSASSIRRHTEPGVWPGVW